MNDAPHPAMTEAEVAAVHQETGQLVKAMGALATGYRPVVVMSAMACVLAESAFLLARDEYAACIDQLAKSMKDDIAANLPRFTEAARQMDEEMKRRLQQPAK